MNLFDRKLTSVGKAAGRFSKLATDVRRAADQLNIVPILELDGCPYYSAAQLKQIESGLRAELAEKTEGTLKRSL